MRSLGHCTRCGKPSAPYYFCEYHRKWKNQQVKAKHTDSLSDSYVKALLFIACNCTLPKKDMPQDLIEM